MKNYKTKEYEGGYLSLDASATNAWVRIFCASLPDGSCGLLLFQHHLTDTSPYFNHRTEANLGLATGGSLESAMARVNSGEELAPIPAAYRRLSRLLSQGSLVESIKDTLAERGLLRAVAYTERSPEDTGLAVFDRAGFTHEARKDKTVRIIELD